MTRNRCLNILPPFLTPCRIKPVKSERGSGTLRKSWFAFIISKPVKRGSFYLRMLTSSCSQRWPSCMRAGHRFCVWAILPRTTLRVAAHRPTPLLLELPWELVPRRVSSRHCLCRDRTAGGARRGGTAGGLPAAAAVPVPEERARLQKILPPQRPLRLPAGGRGTLVPALCHRRLPVTAPPWAEPAAGRAEVGGRGRRGVPSSPERPLR